MTRPRTGAERYFDRQLEDPEFHEAYDRSRRRIAQFDRVIEALDERRTALALTKAELARRAGLPPEAVRRLFTASHVNPTLGTLVALSDALGLDLALHPQHDSHAQGPVNREPGAVSGTRRRSA